MRKLKDPAWKRVSSAPVLGQPVGLAGRGRPQASAKCVHPGQSLALMLHVHLPGRGEGWPASPLGPEDSEEQGTPLPPLGPSGAVLTGLGSG